MVVAVFQVDASIPMFVFLGRLDAQKGVDVMFESIDKVLTRRVFVKPVAITYMPLSSTYGCCLLSGCLVLLFASRCMSARMFTAFQRRGRCGVFRPTNSGAHHITDAHICSGVHVCYMRVADVAHRDAIAEQALEGGMKAQFVTMGSGIEELEEVAADLEDKYPANFRAVLSFKGNEKYKTYAAADFALMPSRYEPCGLVQMESMRFGTLPIVSPTGGLADTVSDMRTGFVMEHEVDQDALAAADVKMIAKNIERAARVFAKTGTYSNMQKAAMKAASGYSWSSSAQQYIQTFAAIGGGRE